MKKSNHLFVCLFLALSVFILSFCMNGQAVAQQRAPLAVSAAVSSIPVPTPLASEKDPGAVITPMQKDQKAPYSGTLFSPKSIAIVIAELQMLPKKCKIEVDTAAARCKADADLQLGMCNNACDASSKILNSRLKMLEGVEAVDKKRIAELEKQQTNPLIWALGGVVGGVVVTGVIVYISHR
jgi:hypothetical protein